MFFHKTFKKAVGVVVAVGLGVCLVCGAVQTGTKEADYKPSLLVSNESEIYSGRHTQYHETAGTVESPYTVDGYTLRLESDTVQVWVLENTAKLRIVDRRSGYVWGLSTDEKPDGLNKSWYAMASSLCAIDYYDEEDSEKRVSTESADVKLKYDWKQDSFLCHIDMKEQEIRLSVEVSLDKDSLQCRVVENSLEEYGKYKIKSLYFMPFLGSTYSDTIDGYFFVPDGCGALLRFQKPSTYNSALEGRVYGTDPGIDSIATAGNLLASRGNDYLVKENVMTLPVYGIVHGEGQNGVLAIIEDGVEQAYITANPAGYITDYNWLSARFAYRTSYMKPVNKAGSGVYTAQEEINSIAPAVKYVFFTGETADYSSMAVYYRDCLVQEGKLTEQGPQEQMPLWLSVLGAEIKEGVLFNTTEVLTTIEDANKITNTLQSAGITNLMACYYGWENGGVNGSNYGELSLERKLGSAAKLSDWRQSVQATGGDLILYRNLGQANEDQLTLRLQSAMNISSDYVHYTVDNETLMYPDSYVIKANTAVQNLSDLRKKWNGYSLALDSVGTNPHSDYDRTNSVSRKETMQILSQMLEGSQNTRTALFQPALYQWENTTDYLDMPMSNSQYLFETDTVPFLQILLKGYLNYYSPYINLGFYSDNAILKMVEYGTYPAFIVAQAESYELENTPLENLFSVNFSDWEESIHGVYSYVAEALNCVEGKRIVEHRMVAEGVACVTYEGDIEIYVNYTDSDAIIGDVTVPARDYCVKGGNP